jgi:nucleobase:cation symporter-1, NCS1 family
MSEASRLSTEEHGRLLESALFNHDLAPVPPERRSWRFWNFAALWISISACIPTYMLASSLIDGGMNWWEAIVTIFLANVIVLIPMVLNAHAGTRYGIPFPVYCRASFGTKGANVPAMLRALVACGWFGIQTWIGGEAIHKILAVFFPSLGGPATNALGVTFSQFVCFLFFWAINMFVIYKGIDSIRILLNIKAPLLIALGLLLLAWAYRAAGGFGPILSQPSAFEPGQPKAGQFWVFFGPALTGMIGFWATLSLNIPDFSRYAHTQKDQILGQSLGLPFTMALYSFIGVAVTSATTIIFHRTIWDPVDVLTYNGTAGGGVVRFTNPVILIVAMLGICIATLATNIAANVVSPANDFAHLAPKKISFRTGGFITGFIGILMMPWKLLSSPIGFITWLIGYGALLGPIGGILIADYFVWRRCKLDLFGLYHEEGRYRFTGGYSIAALAALALGIAPSLPGFLVTVKALPETSIAPIFMTLYSYAWFVGFFVAFAVYLVARLLSPAPSPAATPEAAELTRS